MRAWTSATASGVCAFNRQHTWREGARIFRLSRPGWGARPKDFCADCATARHDAPPDTGEFLDLESAANYPTMLKVERLEEVRPGVYAQWVDPEAPPAFDAKAAAAHDVEDEA